MIQYISGFSESLPLYIGIIKIVVSKIDKFHKVKR